jgi:hypothetical protein
MSERTTTGSCLCGAIQFEIRGPQRGKPGYCHCVQCRRGVGATPVAWATFERAALSIRAGTPAWFQSSPTARRGFCSTCGSSLFFEASAEPDVVDVTVASLDQADDFAPAMHIFVPSKVAWARLDDGLPQHQRDSRSPRV